MEFNLLGLSFGVDVLRPALRLPAIGRLGVPEDVSRSVSLLTEQERLDHSP